MTTDVRRAPMAVFIFDLDTPNEAPGARPCYLIGPFDSFDAMEAWIADNDGRLSLDWQPITLPDCSGRPTVYTPELATQALPVLSQLPEAKARFERAVAIQAAMQRAEDRQEEWLETHDMPLPSRPN
jgi:hypothetical protein